MKRIIKKIWPELIIFALFIACGGGLPILRAATVTTMVTYQYSSDGTVQTGGFWPACTSTITSTCIKGIRVYDTTTSTFSVIGTMSNPATPVGSQTWSQDFADPSLSYGKHNAEFTVVYNDSSGAEKETAYSAPVLFTYSAGAPTAVITGSVSAK